MHEHKPTNPESSGTITKIEHQERNPGRYNIYIDHEYAFSVHEEVVIPFRLLKGRQIDRREIEQILQEEEKNKMERAGLRYLSYRPRTTQEMVAYFRRKQFQEPYIAEVIDKWQEEGYLDDETFARQWIQERMQSKRKGRYMLGEELKHKGIGNEIIEYLLEEIDPALETEACLAAAEKKIVAYQGMEEWKRKHKLFQYLCGRGFPYDVICEVYSQLPEED